MEVMAAAKYNSIPSDPGRERIIRGVSGKGFIAEYTGTTDPFVNKWWWYHDRDVYGNVRSISHSHT